MLLYVSTVIDSMPGVLTRILCHAGCACTQIIIDIAILLLRRKKYVIKFKIIFYVTCNVNFIQYHYNHFSMYILTRIFCIIFINIFYQITQAFYKININLSVCKMYKPLRIIYGATKCNDAP